ncbi:BspA family leucine-rich repeat surface protein, partial [Enterococcus sp. 3H8_DIV0648]|uniref:BspA family leucine-rich repeat surface protein n=2 Tax=Enterococcus sp. 3H8_DIV0648 TaxID=1834178 RepID=UPI000B6762DF
GWNTSKVENMGSMFSGCSQLEDLNLSSWNTSQVQYMGTMFSDCSELKKLNLSGWNTSKVYDMNAMFYSCSQLQKLDLSGWNTSKVENMGSMFSGCSQLEDLNLSDWNTSQVQDMSMMFYACTQLQDLNLTGWNTGKVVNMYSMFYECSQLKELNLSDWNTSQVQIMFAMFRGCSQLQDLNLTGWNTSNVLDMGGMFYGSDNLSKFTLSSDFEFQSGHSLRGLPANSGKTTYHWVKDEYKADYDSTADFTTAHNNLTGASKNHVYTIQKKHEVSFNLNGGSGNTPDPQYIFEGKLADAPDYKGTKGDLIFDDWTLNSVPFTFDKQITEPVELTARWRKARYTIKFDPNDGEGTMSDQELSVDEELLLPANQFTRKGYDFDGWNKESGGGGDSYSDKEAVKNLSKTDGAQVKLYAQWNPITYTVTFDTKDGKPTTSKNYTIEKGIDSFGTPTRSGYTFDGWYDGKEKVTNIKEGETGNRTLIAKWTPVTYKVTFDSAGGNAIDLMSYTIEEKISSLPTPTRKGYKFMGWFEGENQVTEIPIGGTSDRTLTAKWEAITYTITFADEGLSPITYTISDQSIPLPDGPERAGYRFLGWLVSEEKLNRSTQSNDAIVRSLAAGTIGNLRLMAQYEAITYKVNFDSAGGSAIDPISFTTENSVAKLPEPARIGYRFLGWYDGETKVTELPKGTIGDKTLTAKWEKIKTIEVIEDILKEENQKNRKEQDYTEDSWKNYQEAKKAAEDLLKEVNPDPLKTEQVLAKLQAAIKGLTLKDATAPTPVGTTNIPVSKKVYPTAQAKQYPRTNMITTVWPGFIGTGLVAAVIALVKKNKK